jgi:hypothetical protein
MTCNGMMSVLNTAIMMHARPTASVESGIRVVA